jgi:hypothetical protein
MLQMPQAGRQARKANLHVLLSSACKRSAKDHGGGRCLDPCASWQLDTYRASPIYKHDVSKHGFVMPTYKS